MSSSSVDADDMSYAEQFRVAINLYLGRCPRYGCRGSSQLSRRMLVYWNRKFCLSPNLSSDSWSSSSFIWRYI